MKVNKEALNFALYWCNLYQCPELEPCNEALKCESCLEMREAVKELERLTK